MNPGWFHQLLGSDVTPLIENGLRDGRVLLLVDGLDEWTDAAAAVESFGHLAVFLRQRDLPLLATSRPGQP